MRVPRMTTRRWMVGVAVVALAMGAEKLRRLSRTYAFLAACHAGARTSQVEFVRDCDGFDTSDREAVAEMIAQFRRHIPWHAALARKYQHAARYPWLPVEPDPPMPEP